MNKILFKIILAHALLALQVSLKIFVQAHSPFADFYYGKMFDQCGGVLNGLNYTGPTVCQPGLTCYFINQYYSVCAQRNPLSIYKKNLLIPKLYL